jgi:hypothetical protein
MTVIFVSGSSSFHTGIFPVNLHGMFSRELDLGLGSNKVAQWVVLQIKCQYDGKNLQVIWNYCLFVYIRIYYSFHLPRLTYVVLNCRMVYEQRI